VEAALRNVVEPARDRGLVHRLSQAAPDVVVADRGVRGHIAGAFSRLGEGGSRNEQGDGGAGGPKVRVHRIFLPLRKMGVACGGDSRKRATRFFYASSITCGLTRFSGCTLAVHRGGRRPGMVRRPDGLPAYAEHGRGLKRGGATAENRSRAAKRGNG